MTEKPQEQPYDLSVMSFEEFLKAQEKLRDNGSPTIPYIDMSSRRGYPASMEVVALVRSYGLEANANLALGGVTAFVDNEQDFANLQRLIREHPEFLVKLPK